MYIGFHTNAFVWAGIKDIRVISDFALKSGFTALEVGPGIDLDIRTFEDVKKKIHISNFIYCRNFISDDTEQALREQKELHFRMKFASEIGVRNFVISTGISQSDSIPESGGCDPLKSIEKVVNFLNETLLLAKQLKLTILLENCPMYRNIATSPLMWKEIFKRVDDTNLGICYDPSHFVWQMIDVIQPIYEFGDKIKQIHLKDTLVDRQILGQVGILHNVGKERGYFENQWWRHTVMGNGDINWIEFKKALDNIGYSEDLSFEMEDYQYECEPEKVKEGLRLQRDYLKKVWNI